MSNFYYCNDCKKAVDLIPAGRVSEYHVNKNVTPLTPVCNFCWGTNWKAMIDSPNGYPKEIK